MGMKLRVHPNAACTPDVLEIAVNAVASERVDLATLIPGLSALEIVHLARGVVEATDLEPHLSELLFRHEPPCGDWASCVLAGLRQELSALEHDRKRPDPAAALLTLNDRTYGLVAVSADRSPAVYYADILAEAAWRLVERGEALGLTLQVDCVAEELQLHPDNVPSAIRELGLLQVRLGQHEEGLQLLTAIQQHHPSDVWGFNTLALMGPGLGLPSLGVLAAERGLALLRHVGDPEQLRRQFEQLRSEASGLPDRSDAPARAVEQLKDAMRADFGPPKQTDMAELAHRLVPQLAFARIKVLPPMLSSAGLSELARRCRALPLKLKPVSTWLPPLAATAASLKVGRNEPCPCGSGKKFKSCCLAS